MNLSAIFSKTGKGVQEASGKTSHLSRADRAVLSAIDGKTPLSKVQENFEKLAGPKFEALITQLDKDGFIREVSSGAAAAPSARPAAPPRAAPPPPPPSGGDDDMDFTQAVKLPPRAPATPKAPPLDLAAAGRADAERKAKEAQELDYKSRQEAEAKAKAEAELKARAAREARLKAEAESKARAEAEARARAEAEAKARADADAKARADTDAKVKAAREAAVRMATEAKAKAEADARAKTEAAEREKAKLEAELNAKLETERKAREDAERRAAEAAEKARKELEEKAKRDAEEMRQRLEAEMKAKLEAEREKADAERRAREEEDRKRREEEDRRRKEEDERRAKEDAERRAREEAERKKREEEDRKRREDEERRRKEDEERRAKEEAERAKADAERRAREEEDRKRRKEEDERRAKEEAERKAREDAERRALEDTNRRLETERRAKEDAERRAREDADRRAKEDAERRDREAAEAKAREAAAALPKIETAAPPPPAASDGIGDSLLADLDSFGKREEEEQREKEEAERKAKEEKARREKEEAERRKREEEDRKRRDEEERRRKEEEARREKEEAERKAREEEERREEEEAERKRKAKEAQAARKAEEKAAKAAGAKARGDGKGDADDDIDVSDADLDLDDLKRDQKIAADKARKAAREAPPVAVSAGRPKKWGKPAAIALFVILVGGLGALHVMPLSTAEYEKAASEAMGVPVKVGSARLSVITGIEIRLEGITIGNAAKIRQLRGTPEVGSLFGARKSFSRVELEGVSITQAQLADALLGKVSGENLRIARIGIKQLALDGPLKLPPLDVDATVAGDGTLQTVKLSGPDKLVLTLTPRNGEIAFDMSASSLTMPFVPALSLSDFAMKGSANATGVVSSEFDGRVYDGVLKGSARIRWGANWSVEGELRANALKAGVFAPTLVSEGRLEGRGAYSMSGSAPASLYESARLQGEFKIEKGVIGSFDLARALQTGGASSGGRTVFNELTGQGLYDKGAVQISNATISAGAMNAGMSLNIEPGGGLSGRVVADVKTASQTIRSTLNISGKVQEPVIRK